jgi:hypothetical protein
MNTRELLDAARRSGPNYQLPINEFIDRFRRATPAEQRSMVDAPLEGMGPLQGLVAAVASGLCREAELSAPAWIDQTASPEPFFAFPARSFAMRLRLMLESPAPFRIRNVFVPENYLSRA